MALKANATLIFTGYDVQDDGTQMTFACSDPGAGEANTYAIVLTDTEFATVVSQLDLRNLVLAKLRRKYRALNIASKLDSFIGQSLQI